MVVDATLYERLGVKPTATQAELKKAYHRFALANHPDKVPESERENAHSRFQQVQAAYDILRDPEQRTIYDERGLEGLKGAAGGGFETDLSDFLNEMFGGGFSMGGDTSGRWGRRTPDAIQPVEVSLEELYVGKHVKMLSKRKVVCSTCTGTGGRANAKPKKCPACSGTGQKVAVDIFNRPARVICGDCSGTGSSLREKDRCKKCKGKKVMEEKKLVEFWIERGMEEGDRIVLPGEADQEPGMETGDVIFIIEEKKHPVFTRVGHNLKATLHITLREALCGFSKVILRTLDGRGLHYTHKVANGKVIKPKDVFKIVGEGMPFGKKSDERGDLYLDVEIEFPEEGWLTDPGELDLLRSLLPTQTNSSQANGVPGIVDDVTLEKADLDEFVGEETGAWETEDEDDSDAVPECQTQ